MNREYLEETLDYFIQLARSRNVSVMEVATVYGAINGAGIDVEILHGIHEYIPRATLNKPAISTLRRAGV